MKTVKGDAVQLLDHKKDGLLVIAYTGVGCPIAGRYAPRLEELHKRFADKGVAFVGINANPQDKPDTVAKDVKELGITFPVLLDHEQALTKQLDVKTTTEAVLLDKQGTIRYRGMIDDQYAIAGQREKPRNNYLERAIREVLAGKTPETQRTVAPGCLITPIAPEHPDAAVTYSSHIASIIQENCQSCHRPTQVGPFPLTSYEHVRGWSAMIHSVVESGRMPPWNASPEFDGVFANERKLKPEDKRMLLAWIEAGMPRGNPGDDPPGKAWPNNWRIGKPDKVYTMPEVFNVPADGVVEYQYFNIPTDFRKDMWIQAMEAQAGAEDVVHHIIAFTVDPKNPTERKRLGLEDGFLCGAVPGDLPSIFPEGRGKKLPAGAALVLQVHYTTNGKPRKDKCKIAMVFADKPVTEEVRTRGIYNLNFTIPPGDPNYEVRSSHKLTEDTQVLSLYPHMHFRGKSWKYVAHLPDGTDKVMLDVPKYNYGWQESYIYRQPVLLPAGTTLECIAHYDNSDDNFVNPDPAASVKFGDQSWEEMMIGYIDYVVAAQ